MTHPVPEYEGGPVGEVVPFPRQPAGQVEPAPALDEIVERVPVDPPAPRQSVGTWLAAVREAQRRPIVPEWARSRAGIVAAVRWTGGYVAHTSAYHLVRGPMYAAALAIRSPRGLVRVVAAAARWLADVESRPARQLAVQRGDVELYVRVRRQHREVLQMRWLAAGVAAAVGVAGVAALVLAAPAWASWAALAGTVGVLGVLGTPADQPIIPRAVVAPRVNRLTSDQVVRALASIGIAALSKGDVAFAAPITRDGPGWRADIELPHGVTVADVAERRDRLASALRRPLGCVWPEPAPDDHPGRLVLWVGDHDMSRAKPAAWPLARGGQADLFKPIPFGTDPRGRAVSVPLMFANVLIGAMPRSGKTFAMRVLLLAAALDPLCELRVWELKGTGDLSSLARVAYHYGSGPDDDTIAACVASLREVHRELERRAKTISGLPKNVCPESKITPQLAAQRSLGLRPMVIGIDECQELFSHPEYGGEAAELCTAIIKRGPALGIILILATQRPDRASLPTGVSANAGIRFCLRVMGQVENDLILGTSMYRNGIRATMFGPRDRGIGYLVGAADDPQIVRTYYIDAPTAERIAQRAWALREQAGTLPARGEGDTPARPRVDVLADVLTVVPATERRVWNEVVAARLRELRPDAYGHLAAAEDVTRLLRPWRDEIPVKDVWGTDPETGRKTTRRGIDRADVERAYRARRRAAAADL